MAQQGGFKKSNKNDDFDLDSYLEEQAHQTAEPTQQIVDEHEPSFLKNAILGLALVFTAFLWYHDWSPKQAYASIFGAEEQRLIAGGQTGNQIVIDIPEITIPEISFPESRDIQRAIEQELARASQTANLPPVTDYLVQLKELGLLDDDKLSAFQARQLHSSGVPVSYIQEVDNAGFLDDLDFVAISEFYNNDIPLSYLSEFEEAGFLDKVSFIGISEFYTNDVSMDYLRTLDQAGYLDDLSFVYITEYYKAGVTTTFLDDLKAKGLYEELSFVDIVEMYKDENN
ncbi:MAG TPA: hypothetical protein DCX27_13075 [Balneola sp.]|nr:hypothetical protein [Balneola sp.]